VEVLVAFDRPRPEAVAPQVAFPLVPAVERLGIHAVEAVAAVGELVAQGFHDEVVVVRHKAEGVDEPIVALDDVREEAQKETAVVVAAKDRRPVDPTRADVERAVREDVPWQAACHAPTVRAVEASPSPDEAGL
jgi:hypothetical protein